MDIKTTAIEAAKKAGEILQELRGKEIKYEMKNTHDILAEADVETERVILETISRDFPEHSIFAEEKGEVVTDSEYTWVIDPLDGTIIFSRGNEEYCTTIAVEKNDETILGLIYQHHFDRLFIAEKGKGAFLNDERLSVSNESDMVNMILSLDNTSHIEYRIKNFEALSKVCDKVRSTRICGSGSLHLTRMASGSIDIYFKLLRCNYWDYAPGALLVKEAGGMVTDLNGEKYTKQSNNFVATNGKLHQEFLDILNNAIQE